MPRCSSKYEDRQVVRKAAGREQPFSLASFKQFCSPYKQHLVQQTQGPKREVPGGVHIFRSATTLLSLIEDTCR